MTIHLGVGRSLDLPDDAITQKYAFLARSGAGKSYGSMVLVEQWLAKRQQVVVLDPVGIWWGLQVGADGKSKGFQIPVFGGEQHNVPLYPENGALVARTIVEKPTSAILDVSHFRKAERVRFMTAFGEEFFHLKKKHRSPVHLVLEEAQTFCPQYVKGVEEMVGTMEDIIKLGRNYGIGATLISQRPQSVNKDVLNQVEVLVVLQTTGPQERKTIKGWIVEQGLDTQKLVDELPGLGKKQKGEAYVWSPSWLGITKRIQIRQKLTFDSSKTPTKSVRAVATKTLTQGELDELQEAMKVAVEKKKQEDPTELRKDNARLKRDLELANKEMGRWAEKLKDQGKGIRVTKITKFALKPSDQKRLKVVADWIRAGKDVLPKIERVTSSLESTFFSRAEPDSRSEVPTDKIPWHLGAKIAPGVIGKKAPGYTSPRKPARPTVAKFTESEGITGPEQRVLDAIAWFNTIGVEQPEQAAVAFKARYALTASSFKSPRGSLRTKGLIDLIGKEMVLTDKGRAVANFPVLPVTIEQLHQEVLENLNGPEQKLLKPLLDIWPKSMPQEELAEKAEYALTASSFKSPRGKLRTYRLIDFDGPNLRARDILFPGSAR